LIGDVSTTYGYEFFLLGIDDSRHDWGPLDVFFELKIESFNSS